MLDTARLTGQTIGAVMLAAIYGVWDLPEGQGETTRKEAIHTLLALSEKRKARLNELLRENYSPPIRRLRMLGLLAWLKIGAPLRRRSSI